MNDKFAGDFNERRARAFAYLELPVPEPDTDAQVDLDQVVMAVAKKLKELENRLNEMTPVGGF